MVVSQPLFLEGATQKRQSKEHCMCIKQKQNISSQSLLRNPSTPKSSFQFVCFHRSKPGSVHLYPQAIIQFVEIKLIQFDIQTVPFTRTYLFVDSKSKFTLQSGDSCNKTRPSKVVVVANSKQKVFNWTQLVVKYTTKNFGYELYTLLFAMHIFQKAQVTSNKMVHKKIHRYLAQFSIHFHIV